jgi:hypothetical protein
VTQPDRYSKCRCQNCGGHIEFPTEGAGQTVNCPHCGWATVLTAEKAPALPQRKPVLLLVLGLVGVAMVVGSGLAFLLLPQLRPRVTVAPPIRQTNQTGPTNLTRVVPKSPDLWHGLVPGAVTVEKSDTGHLIYAVGSIHNTADHERFGVRVDLDILDATKKKIGTASDYTQSIEPGKSWKFRAMVTDRNGVSAKITAVKED